MIKVVGSDCLGKKVLMKCNTDDTIGDLKRLITAQSGTCWKNMVLKMWYMILKTMCLWGTMKPIMG
ncbi:hypothetical protein FD755_001473 [Muntiacus reevesi]|uniref:Ubiquitin-like protein 5 n=1 Tax=Muntiacus reevesi TaxID=9886 RepID=A0A5J5N1C2_MUNRE|nr:hypothetical protein FD755_001473 [Muntiacus reevesi]